MNRTMSHYTRFFFLKAYLSIVLTLFVTKFYEIQCSKVNFMSTNGTSDYLVVVVVAGALSVKLV